MSAQAETLGWDELLGRLADAAVVALRAQASTEDPVLETVFRTSIRFAVFDDAAATITPTSLALGLIASGSAREGKDPPPTNAAQWIADWLKGQEADVYAHLRREQVTDHVQETVAQATQVRFDRGAERLVEAATRFASGAEPGAQFFRAPHLTAVMLMPGGVLATLAEELRWLDAAGLERGRQEFLSFVLQTLPEGSAREAWFRTYQALPALPAPPGPPLVSTFAPDRPAADLDGPDPMKIDKDVIAFARLIAHTGMATPLAIGVFGAWGSGKSTFMERLEKHIDRLAAPDRRDAGRDGFVSSVVHIRFNAWSFADANLWASLGAEFFDQLRVGGHSKLGSHIHANLVERVTTHVHDLRSTAEATRAVAHEGERALALAQQARDKAVKGARKGAMTALPQAMLDGLARAHEVYGKEFGHKEEDLAGLIKTTRAVQTTWGRGATAVKVLWGGGWRTVMPLVLMAGFVGLVAAASAGWLDLGWKTIAAALGPGALGVLAALGSGLRQVSRFAQETATFAKQLKKGDDDRIADVLKAELTLKDAAEEADARRKAAERATRALARYIDPKGTANPPRLLRYVLEDDPATRALEKEIGLISRTRRLFEAVDEILQEDRRSRAAGGEGDRDTPERIVIYIDDLDRCTQEQVQSVLQAVHLLLAFESFVVVVGVDKVRVAEALARQFDDDDDPTNDDAEEVARRMDRAVLYLEKIFQLAFRLQPLSPAGKDGGAYGRFVMDLTSPPAAAAKAAADEDDGDDAETVVKGWRKPDQPETPLVKIARELGVPPPPIPAPPPAEKPTPPPTAREALSTLILDGAEAKFLASVAIGTVAGSTPRNVKRMLNVYRLARVRLSEDGFDLLGKSGPPLYPLLALFAAIDTGRKPQVAKRVFEALGVDETPLDAIVRFALSPADATSVTDAVSEVYGRLPTAKDCRDVAGLVRRYSFNALEG